MSQTEKPGTQSVDEPETHEQSLISENSESTDRQGETRVTVEHSPSRRTQVVAVGGALITMLLTAPFATLSIPFGIGGFVITVGSMFVTYSAGWLTVGSAMLLVGALITGSYGALPPEIMLLAVGTAIISWDTGRYGILIGAQLGRQASTQLNELIHTAGSVLAVGLVSTIVYIVYLLGGSGLPAQTVTLLVVGTVVLALVLRK